MSTHSEHNLTTVSTIPKSLRLLQVASAVLSWFVIVSLDSHPVPTDPLNTCLPSLLAAGVIFGFTALKPILVRQGIYQFYVLTALS